MTGRATTTRVAFMDGFGAAQDGESVTAAWATFKAWIRSFGDSDA